MPRKSPLVITLTASERLTLETTAGKYTSPYKKVNREKIILMAELGLDIDEVARRLDTSRQIVSKWRKRFYENGLQGLQDQPRVGRSGSLSPCGGR